MGQIDWLTIQPFFEVSIFASQQGLIPRWHIQNMTSIRCTVDPRALEDVVDPRTLEDVQLI